MRRILSPNELKELQIWNMLLKDVLMRDEEGFTYIERVMQDGYIDTAEVKQAAENITSGNVTTVADYVGE